MPTTDPQLFRGGGRRLDIVAGEGFRVEASMGYQRPHFNKQTPKSVALLFPAYGTNHEPVAE